MSNKILWIGLLWMAGHFAYAQNDQTVKDLITEGVALHDKGDFAGAIAKYDQALKLDRDNLYALSEKAISLTALKRYEEAIAIGQKLIKKHPGHKALKTVYVTCGNAYDALKKPDKAIEMYDNGIKQFPDFFLLYFNKGITLALNQRLDEAEACFEKSAALNPRHASSLNVLGRVLAIKEKRIPALMVCARFLALEPEGKRAKENLALVLQIMKGDVEQKDEQNIAINIPPDVMAGSKPGAKPAANNFASTYLLLAMTAGLDFDEQYQKETEAERFTRKMELVCQSLKENQKDNHGFYWSFFAPYFIEMKEQNLVKTFAHIALAASGDPAVAKWLGAHQKEIDQFYEWSNNFAWKSDHSRAK